MIGVFQFRSPGRFRRLRRRLAGGSSLLLIAVAPAFAHAQFARDSSADWLASAGSEGERYLRVMQVTGQSRPGPWSVPGISMRERRHLAPLDSTHPWAGQLSPRSVRSRWIRAVQPELAGIVNTTFPYGLNDGPLWVGRGLTLSAVAGVEGEIGPLEFEIAPQVFRTTNGAFPLASTGRPGLEAFGEAYSNAIDLPQRFGDGAYQRADMGQSSIRLHVSALTAGVSTANEVWGPAVENPFILGANAAGFPHAVVGTDHALVFGPLSWSLRVLVGRLDQSAYAPPAASTHRSLAASVVSLGLRRVPGLEIGFARAVMSLWPDSGVNASDLVRPLLRTPARKLPGLANAPEHQLASVFARWNFPESGVEVYGEFGREDNFFDLRDLIEEPDHDVSFLIGFERAWRPSSRHVVALRGELMNSGISHLDLVRSQAPRYVHEAAVHQGYTQRGKVLGAPAGFGGGGAVLAVDWFSPQGRRTVTWRRTLREPVPVPQPKNVQHAVSAEWMLFRRGFDLIPEVTGVYELDRPGWGDVMNLRLALTARAHW